MSSPPSYPNYPAQAPSHYHGLGGLGAGGVLGGGGAGGASPFVGPGGHTHCVDQSQPIPNSRWSEQNLLLMISTRLGWNVDIGRRIPFDKLVPVKVTDETIAVFVVVGSKALIIEDDANMFPSDAFITQLRILGEVVR